MIDVTITGTATDLVDTNPTLHIVSVTSDQPVITNQNGDQSPDEMIDCPTPAQREVFGPRRRRVPEMMDLKNPILLGHVQNQEHHMNGVVARRNNFNEPILKFLEQAYEEFGHLTGRYYHLVSEYKTEDADTVFVSLGCAAENIEAACDY